jgi:hypothetical protein
MLLNLHMLLHTQRSAENLIGLLEACRTHYQTKREASLPQLASLYCWSGRRVSNSRPQPWQGCALPTELLPRDPATTQTSILQCITFALLEAPRTNHHPISQLQNAASNSGAGDESRTRDLNLGKVALYQLSYSRIASVLASISAHSLSEPPAPERRDYV